MTTRKPSTERPMEPCSRPSSNRHSPMPAASADVTRANQLWTGSYQNERSVPASSFPRLGLRPALRLCFPVLRERVRAGVEYVFDRPRLPFQRDLAGTELRRQAGAQRIGTFGCSRSSAFLPAAGSPTPMSSIRSSRFSHRACAKRRRRPEEAPLVAAESRRLDAGSDDAVAVRVPGDSRETDITL